MYGLRVEHVECCVGDAHLAAYFFVRALGFQLIADAGFEHRARDQRSISLGSGAIRIVLTSPLGPDSSVSRFFAEHGDGVRDIAFEVPNCAASFDAAVRAGATVADPPRKVRIGDTRMLSASVPAVGDLVYSFVERHGLRRSVYPTVPVVPPPREPSLDPTLVAFDHFAICVRRGELDAAVAWHESVLGMPVAHEEHVEGRLGGMRLKALQSNEKHVEIVLLEPSGSNEGQIDDFIRRNAGPGVRHFAVLTDDVFAAVTRLRARPRRRQQGPTSKSAQFDLSLMLFEQGGRFGASLSYDLALFERSTIERMGSHVVTLLAGALARPDAPISSISLLSEAERWNQKPEAVPDSTFVHEMFERALDRTPAACSPPCAAPPICTTPRRSVKRCVISTRSSARSSSESGRPRSATAPVAGEIADELRRRGRLRRSGLAPARNLSYKAAPLDPARVPPKRHHYGPLVTT